MLSAAAILICVALTAFVAGIIMGVQMTLAELLPRRERCE
jgi:hypothetical protein